MKTALFFSTFFLASKTYAETLLTPKDALEGAALHTTIVNNVEEAMRTKAPKDIAEYTLSIVDACEKVCAPDDKQCLRDVHKAVIFGAINHNGLTQALRNQGPVEVLHSMTPEEMHPDMKEMLSSSINKLTYLDKNNMNDIMSTIEDLRDSIMEGDFNGDETHFNTALGTTSIAIESTKQWRDIGLNQKSTFHNLYQDLMCLDDPEKNDRLMQLGSNIDNHRLGGKNRNLQITITTILTPILVFMIPFFDILGFLVGATAASSATLSSLSAMFITTVYFSLFGPVQCTIDIFNCFDALVEFANGDFSL